MSSVLCRRLRDQFILSHSSPTSLHHPPKSVPLSSSPTITHTTLSDSTTRDSYRGDTLRLSQDGHYLYATTRGKTSSTKGYITTWFVYPSSFLSEEPLKRWETPTSGGKSNAIEAFPFHSLSRVGGKDWIVLTDDEEGMGYIWIIEWDGEDMFVLSTLRILEEDQGVGSSHAVWLS